MNGPALSDSARRPAPVMRAEVYSQIEPDRPFIEAAAGVQVWPGMQSPSAAHSPQMLTGTMPMIVVMVQWPDMQAMSPSASLRHS